MLLYDGRNLSVLERLKCFSISTSQELSSLSTSLQESLSTKHSADLSYDRLNITTNSALSVFSGSLKNDAESVYSELSSCSSEQKPSLDLIKSFTHKRANSDAAAVVPDGKVVDDLVMENQMLRFYLKKAFGELNDGSLKNEIKEAMDWE